MIGSVETESYLFDAECVVIGDDWIEAVVGAARAADESKIVDCIEQVDLARFDLWLPEWRSPMLAEDRQSYTELVVAGADKNEMTMPEEWTMYRLLLLLISILKT